MARKAFAVLAALLCLCGARAGAQTPSAQTPAAAPAEPTGKNNYADDTSWLCRPGRQDACAVDMSATVVAANGTLAREAFTANANAPIDCFYVYPTVSTDATVHSDMNADPAELNVIRSQFARFASVCKPYAPLYRQVTLRGLQRAMAGGNPEEAMQTGMGYDDVADAWRHYLENDNKGRGVVLVAHSQGSFILMELMKREIDGKPIQSRMVSAILMGTTLAVPKGKDVGGQFKSIPLCHKASDTGCVITFASFRSTITPPANSLFGRLADPNMVAACTNPANLAGGSGELKAYLSSTGRTIVGGATPKPWVTPEKTIETPWVSVPGLLTARCASNENATGYLEVTVHGNPSDPRVDDITGDLGNPPQAMWGLHLIDAGLTMGNLLDIVREETKAFAARKK